jgi:hypothetical protein
VVVEDFDPSVHYRSLPGYSVFILAVDWFQVAALNSQIGLIGRTIIRLIVKILTHNRKFFRSVVSIPSANAKIGSYRPRIRLKFKGKIRKPEDSL